MAEEKPATLTADDARSVFVRWEKLRPVYNAIVGLVGLAAIAPYVIDFVDPSFMPGYAPSVLALVVGTVAYGVGANVCYFLGPALECYLQWLGVRLSRMTALLFALGTLFSVLLTAAIGCAIWLVMALHDFPCPAD